MTLPEIRHLLHFKDEPDANCGEVDALLDKHIDHVASKILELSALRDQLVFLRTHCRTENATNHCGILNELATVGGSITGARGQQEMRVDKNGLKAPSFPGFLLVCGVERATLHLGLRERN